MVECETARNERTQPLTRHAWCRVGHAFAVSVALLGIAAIHVACGALVASHPSASDRPVVLARRRFGHVIEDGVGYGETPLRTSQGVEMGGPVERARTI